MSPSVARCPTHEGSKGRRRKRRTCPRPPWRSVSWPRASLRPLVEVRRRRHVVTPRQQQQRTERITAQLQAAGRVLRRVAGNGDCLLASVLLGCEAIGIDVCKERGLKSAHASCLRTFMDGWIREH